MARSAPRSPRSQRVARLNLIAHDGGTSNQMLAMAQRALMDADLTPQETETYLRMVKQYTRFADKPLGTAEAPETDPFA